MHESLTALTIPGWEHHPCPLAPPTIGALYGEGIGPRVVEGGLSNARQRGRRRVRSEGRPSTLDITP